MEVMELVMEKIEIVIDSIRFALAGYHRVAILKEKDGVRYLPMCFGETEADAIGAALQKVRFSEPYTWNTLGAITSKLGDKIRYVVIDESKENTLQAKAILEKEGLIEVSCTPSDALVAAVRAGSPIFIDEAILIKSGITSSEHSSVVI
jgi:bifunctional DNase/RNase